MTNNYRRLLVSICFLVLQGISPLIALAEPTTVDQTLSSDVPTIADTSDALPDLPDEPKKESETAPKQTDVEPDADPEGEDDETSEEPLSDKTAANTNKGATPYATTLIEGVDIDAAFANLLRTVKGTTNNYGSWSGYGKAQDQLTVSDMEALTQISIYSRSLTSFKGLEYAINLEILNCGNNSLTELDVSNNQALTTLYCQINSLTELDVSNNLALSALYCQNNSLTELDISHNLVLTTLDCNGNSLTELDISTSLALTSLDCRSNSLTELDVSNSPALTSLDCRYNSLTELDVSNNPALTTLDCSFNSLTELDVSNNPALTTLDCSFNSLTELDVSNNPALITLVCLVNSLTELNVSTSLALTSLDCRSNSLTELDVSNNPALITLYCRDNSLTELDVSNKSALTSLDCRDNSLTELNISNNPALTFLDCSNNLIAEFDLSSTPVLENLVVNRNRLTNLDLTNNYFLEYLSCASNQLIGLDLTNNSALIKVECSDNRISDFTTFMGITSLSTIYANNQVIDVDVPPVIGGTATVDVLKTTASTGLSVNNVSIIGSPIITPNGDIIELSNVTHDSIAYKELSFDYSSSDLVEGDPSSTNKSFSGIIRFAPASDLENTLVPNKTKVETGEEVSWIWSIKGLNTEKAENIFADLSLPVGLVIDTASIQLNGSSGTMADIDGTNNLGALDLNETIEITFKTTANGNPDEWLASTGKLKWEDTSPRANQAEGSVQIKDDEQTYTPQKFKDMALLSIPESFRFGISDVKNTAQVFNLSPNNYMTNTNVVSDGFYTRLRDDRSPSTGWKLSAQLSDFTDSANNLMPNSTGTSLWMQDMTIEAITDRDTPSEAINPSPIGTPSTVVTDETLVAGQTAQPLVTANAGEGTDTWQLRIPFDKVSLNLPANAGKKNTTYSAALTWSLDDTP